MTRRRSFAAILVSTCLWPGVALAQHHAHHPTPPVVDSEGTPDADEPAPHAARIEDTTPLQPIPVPTDSDRAAAFPVLATTHMAHAPTLNWRTLFNRFEAHDGAHGTAQAWEAQAWLGGDIDRLWIRSEGERAGGRTESANIEALYGRSVSPWWDLVAGVRQDFAPGDGRTWAAFGIQGMAPYRFEVSATAYLGESGRSAATLEIEYEMLVTNRLVLQPALEATFYGKDDPRNGTGSGLATAEAGLRLRYEVTRRFAPYLGYAWSRAFGGTADLREMAGDAITDDAWVAGIRFWF